MIALHKPRISALTMILTGILFINFLSLPYVFAQDSNRRIYIVSCLELLLLDDHLPLLPPDLIYPADGSCINTEGSTSVTVNFKWEPVEEAKQYYYKVWSSYPPEELTGWTTETEVRLRLWYIHESGNYSARYNWQLLSGEGPYLSEYSEKRSLTIRAAAFPCN